MDLFAAAGRGAPIAWGGYFKGQRLLCGAVGPFHNDCENELYDSTAFTRKEMLMCVDAGGDEWFHYFLKHCIELAVSLRSLD